MARRRPWAAPVREPDRPAPPPRRRERGVVVRLAAPQRPCEARDRRRPRRAAADVEGAGLVAATDPRQQAVPVAGAEERPDRDGADVGALRACLLRRLPRLREPAQLLLAGAAVLHLRQRERKAIPLPRLPEHADEARARRLEDAVRERVGVTVAPVAAALVLRIQLEPLVEKALAREVVVEADDVRRRVLADELLKEPPRLDRRVRLVGEVRNAHEEVLTARLHLHPRSLCAAQRVLDEEHAPFARAATQQVLRALPDEVPAQVRQADDVAPAAASIPVLDRHVPPSPRRLPRRVEAPACRDRACARTELSPASSGINTDRAVAAPGRAPRSACRGHRLAPSPESDVSAGRVR